MTDTTPSLLPELIKFTRAIADLKISRAKAERLLNTSDRTSPGRSRSETKAFFASLIFEHWIDGKADDANAGRQNMTERDTVSMPRARRQPTPSSELLETISV
jgi:hypothetical protein